MCLGIYVYCVLVVLCLSLGCVFCFLCGWSCLGLRVCVWCIGCWVIWCACVSWVFCVCVWVAYCMVWRLYWFVVFGVLVVGLCLCGCGGFRGLGVCCFLFLGFGLVLFFGWLLGFCFLLGGGVLVWLVVCFCWLFGWFLCVGGGGLRLIFWELYYLC